MKQTFLIVVIAVMAIPSFAQTREDAIAWLENFFRHHQKVVVDVTERKSSPSTRTFNYDVDNSPDSLVVTIQGATTHTANHRSHTVTNRYAICWKDIASLPPYPEHPDLYTLVLFEDRYFRSTPILPQPTNAQPGVAQRLEIEVSTDSTNREEFRDHWRTLVEGNLRLRRDR
jgi:hypothetical protein